MPVDPTAHADEVPHRSDSLIVVEKTVMSTPDLEQSRKAEMWRRFSSGWARTGTGTFDHEV